MNLFQWPAKSKYGRKVVLQICTHIFFEISDVFLGVTRRFLQLRNVNIIVTSLTNKVRTRCCLSRSAQNALVACLTFI